MCPDQKIDSGTHFDEDMVRSARVAGINREWQKSLHYATRYVFPKNAVIPHDSKPGVYYLAKGAVVLTYCSACGRERITLFYEEGSIFNEARTFSGYDPDGRFSCATDVEVYLFSKQLLFDFDFIRKNPNLIQNLLKTMGMKILLHYSFLSEMGTGNRMMHVCRLLLSMSKKNGNLLLFSAGMTQQEVANLLGMHRTTLARILRRLIKIGIISKFTLREVRIVNYELLQMYAEK